jgi:hypothetical protein
MHWTRQARRSERWLCRRSWTVFPCFSGNGDRKSPDIPVFYVYIIHIYIYVYAFYWKNTCVYIYMYMCFHPHMFKTRLYIYPHMIQ